jgi:hypothetical protein
MIDCVLVFASGERLPGKLTGYASGGFDVQIDPTTPIGAFPPSEVTELHFPDQGHQVKLWTNQVPGLPLRLTDLGPAPP